MQQSQIITILVAAKLIHHSTHHFLEIAYYIHIQQLPCKCIPTALSREVDSHQDHIDVDMGWTKEVMYEAVKKNDEIGNFMPISASCNIKITSCDDSWSKEQHLSRKFYNKLMLHTLSSALIIASLTMHVTYLLCRVQLYWANWEEVLWNRPWLLILGYCEFIYLCSACLNALDNLLPPSSRPDLGMLDTKLNYCPTIDIMVPCCREPTEVPVESVKAALAVDYPADRCRVLVLDDGGDDELRSVCNSIFVETGGRVEYIRREKKKSVPHHFKCGNLNHGLKFSAAEYIVVMDADMILHSSYLRRVLPHILNSPGVSYVQVPQSFYNLPVGDPLNNSGTLGYNRTLPHRDSLGFAFCVGTGVLFRRKHLDEIGGFQPHSITEDTMTSVVLLKKGYESVFINERLQVGLTAWTFEGYVRQRQRWATGAIQQFIAAANWRSGGKLNLVQKLLFFHHTGYYILCFNNTLVMVMMVVALAFELKLSVGSVVENMQLTKYLAVYVVLARLAWISLWLNMPQGMQMRNRDESHFWWTVPYFLQACVTAVTDFKSSFVFVPTSNIDMSAAAAAQKSTSNIKSPALQPSNSPSWSWTMISRWLKSSRCMQLRFVKFHIAFVAIAVSVVSVRSYHLWYSQGDCGEKLRIVGLSFFLMCTCAHMLVPVTFILFPMGFKPAQRKSLLKYDAEDVPHFSPEGTGVPKWSWTVLPYEILSLLNLTFWISVLMYTIRNPSGEISFISNNWCSAQAKSTIL